MSPAIDDDAFAEILAAGRAAAALTMQHFRSGERIAGRIDWKAGNSPVTEVDFAVDLLLRERLSAILPDAGWLSEETVDTPARLRKRTVFVVDPIDGTRGFMTGDPRFAVSIAVVVDGRPLAALVHAPAIDQVFTARLGLGAFVNDRPLAIASRDTLAGATIAGPKFLIDSLARTLSMTEQPKVPSLALRLAQVASGDFDAAVASADAHDWDVAASDLIVQEAGGRLRTLDGAELLYNRPETKHGILIAAHDTLQPPIRDALTDIVREWKSRKAAPG